MKINKAILHLVSFNECIDKSENENNSNDESNDSNYVKIPTLEQLQTVYSNFKPVRGDIIVNADECGYRSHGVYFYDGEKIINQSDKYDDYGNPPLSFRICTEFMPGYWDMNLDTESGWDNFIDHCDKVDEVDLPQWHSSEESAYTALDKKIILDNLKKSVEFTYNTGLKGDKGKKVKGFYFNTEMGKFLYVYQSPIDLNGDNDGDDFPAMCVTFGSFEPEVDKDCLAILSCNLP